MYYRLLAPHLLPGHVHRILYLDPDTLVINPLRPLWDMDLNGNLFAAAAHTGKTELANSINQLRLGTDHNYFNSGVLLMDLDSGVVKSSPKTSFVSSGNTEKTPAPRPGYPELPVRKPDPGA